MQGRVENLVKSGWGVDEESEGATLKVEIGEPRQLTYLVDAGVSLVVGLRMSGA